MYKIINKTEIMCCVPLSWRDPNALLGKELDFARLERLKVLVLPLLSQETDWFSWLSKRLSNELCCAFRLCEMSGVAIGVASSSIIISLLSPESTRPVLPPLPLSNILFSSANKDKQPSVEELDIPETQFFFGWWFFFESWVVLHNQIFLRCTMYYSINFTVMKNSAVTYCT